MTDEKRFELANIAGDSVMGKTDKENDFIKSIKTISRGGVKELRSGYSTLSDIKGLLGRYGYVIEEIYNKTGILLSKGDIIEGGVIDSFYFKDGQTFATTCSEKSLSTRDIDLICKPTKRTYAFFINKNVIYSTVYAYDVLSGFDKNTEWSICGFILKRNTRKYITKVS